jgi:hypothetical protein
MISKLKVVGLLDREVCRSDAEARFSIERVVAQHIAIYQQVISQSSPPIALIDGVM